MLPSNQNMDFWNLPISNSKKFQKISWFWVKKKYINAQINFGTKKTKNDTTNNLYIGI